MNANYRRVRDNMNAQFIDEGLFIDGKSDGGSNEPIFRYLFIFDWSNGNYEMRENFLEKLNHTQLDDAVGSFQLDFDQQIDEIIESKTNSIANGPAASRLDEQKQKCLGNVLKALENKERAADLIIEEASVEAKRKLSLISELTNINVLKQSAYHRQVLPRVVEFYNDEFATAIRIEPDESDIGKSNNTTISSLTRFKLTTHWTCFLGDSFSFNFVFRNESTYFIFIYPNLFL